MFAALIKAAIFYFVFLQLRKLLRSSGVFENKKAQTQHVPPHHHSQQDHRHHKTNNDSDVIEADYRIID